MSGLGPKHGGRRHFRVWPKGSSGHATGWHHTWRRLHAKALREEAKKEEREEYPPEKKPLTADQELAEWEEWILRSLGKRP